MIVFLSRRSRPVVADQPAPLPPVHLPLLAVVGAGLLVTGGLAWTIANPLLDLNGLDLSRLALNSVLAAAAGAFMPLCYTRFVAGRADPLMATRGLAAGTVSLAAGAPFVAPWAALAIGGAAGLLIPLVVYLVDHVLRWDDPTAVLPVHGLGGALGLLSVGLFADGLAGQGWNGVGAHSYLGVIGQGVTGLLAAPGYRPDWPGQMQAQIVGLAALTLLGFFAAWLLFVPPALLARLLQRQPAPAALSAEGARAPSVQMTAAGEGAVVIEAPGPATVQAAMIAPAIATGDGVAVASPPDGGDVEHLPA
jgi:Amt family ammonium transporter